MCQPVLARQKGADVKTPLVLILLFHAALSFADLKPLGDSELSAATGEGLGLVLEDFVFNADDAVTTVSGIANSQGEEILVKWTDLYIMGEGSNKGSIETPADIGTLAHPWTLSALPGSEISSVSDSLAVLQLAADKYTDPLNNTADYANWAYYQELSCLSGGACGSDPANAVSAIDTQIDFMQNRKDQIATRYGNDVIGLDSQIQQDISTQINPQKAVVEAERADVGPAYDVMATRYTQVSGVSLGEKVDCGFLGLFCNSAERSYNDSVDAYQTQLSQYTSAQRELARRWNETKWMNVSLKDRLNDLEQYESLCGEVSSTNVGCSEGAIVVRQAQRGKVNDVAVGIGAGLTRRGGIDIGSKFEFEVYDSTSGSYRTDYFNVDLSGVTLDGSYIRLWGSNGDLDGEVNLKLFADSLSIATCGPACTPAQVQASTLTGTNVYLNLALGYGKAQPLKFNVTADGQFEAELPKLKYEDHVDFYQNAPKTSVFIGNVNLGGNNDLGSLTVDGLRFNYLKVNSHDL